MAVEGKGFGVWASSPAARVRPEPELTTDLTSMTKKSSYNNRKLTCERTLTYEKLTYARVRPEPENPNPRSKKRNPRPEIRNPRPENPEVRNPRPENPEIRNPRFEKGIQTQRNGTVTQVGNPS